MTLMSASRSAAFAGISGVLLSTVIFIVSGQANKLSGLKSKKIFLFYALSCAVIIIFWFKVRDIIVSFFQKGGRDNAETIGGLFEASRGSLVAGMLENIENNFYFGIGFGLPSRLDNLIVNRDPFFGLPLSVPIEKGVMFIAVIEELGIVLGAILFLWFLYIIFLSYRNGVTALSITLCFFIVNFFEAVFFSPGGMGLLLMILLSAAISKPRRPLTARLQPSPLILTKT
jgi:hypothetical protein